MSSIPATDTELLSYFSSHYPTDLMQRMIGSLGLRRVRTEKQVRIFKPRYDKKRAKIQEDSDGSDVSDDDNDHDPMDIVNVPSPSPSSPPPPTWFVQHTPFSGAHSKDVFRNQLTLHLHLAFEPGLQSMHVHSTTVRADSSNAQHNHQFMYLFNEREFVIDMDLRDHENVYTPSRSLLCDCDIKNVCSTCWLIADMGAAAARRLFSVHPNTALGPMLVVYSGGKGCHLWWGSPAARRLEEEERTVFVQTLLNPHFKETPATPLFIRKARQAAVEAIHDVWFKRGIIRRALLADPHTSRLGRYLKSLASARFAWPIVDTQLAPAQRSRLHWQAFSAEMGRSRILDICCHFGWPVIDEQVTRGASAHTLKTPFSVHSSSGRIALPLSTVDDAVIRLQQHSLSFPRDMPHVKQSHAFNQHPLWQEARKVLQQWLDACEYPPTKLV